MMRRIKLVLFVLIGCMLTSCDYIDTTKITEEDIVAQSYIEATEPIIEEKPKNIEYELGDITQKEADEFTNLFNESNIYGCLANMYYEDASKIDWTKIVFEYSDKIQMADEKQIAKYQDITGIRHGLEYGLFTISKKDYDELIKGYTGLTTVDYDEKLLGTYIPEFDSYFILYGQSIYIENLQCVGGTIAGDTYTLRMVKFADDGISYIEDGFHNFDNYIVIKKIADNNFQMISCTPIVEEFRYENSIRTIYNPEFGELTFMAFSPDDRMSVGHDGSYYLFKGPEIIWCLGGDNLENTIDDKLLNVDSVSILDISYDNWDDILIQSTYEDQQGRRYNKYRVYTVDSHNGYYNFSKGISDYLNKTCDGKDIDDVEKRLSEITVFGDYEMISYYKSKQSTLHEPETSKRIYADLCYKADSITHDVTNWTTINEYEYRDITWEDFIKKYDVSTEDLNISKSDWMGINIVYNFDTENVGDNVFLLTNNRILVETQGLFIVEEHHIYYFDN